MPSSPLVRAIGCRRISTVPTGSLPISKVAVLACLNIASRHVRLQQEHENYQIETEERLKRLNELIRARLIKD